MIHIVDTIADGLGYTPQEVCQKFDYDVFVYIWATIYVDEQKEKFQTLYEEMIQEQKEQDRLN